MSELDDAARAVVRAAEELRDELGEDLADLEQLAEALYLGYARSYGELGPLQFPWAELDDQARERWRAVALVAAVHGAK